MNIYKIPESLEEVMNIEDDELRRLELTKLEIKANNTFTGLINYIQNKESDCAEIDIEIKRLSELKRIRNNKVEQLKEYIKGFMVFNNIAKQEFPTFTISVAKNPPSVMIEDENNIPNEYKIERVEIQIDKTAIKTAIQAGIVVPGANLITNKTSLRIK